MHNSAIRFNLAPILRAGKNYVYLGFREAVALCGKP